MASISLRAYLQDIETLINQTSLDEAIAHCMHILQYVPKHIGTYRLLGKALHEAQRFTDAADVFQRVLAAIPDDFVANVGLSIIRQDENNLDAAIWHMERAYEAQPSNQAIQEELRRLYGRRDGLEPPRIRLTRGALARMYIKGRLYQQAIAELRAALAEDPQRADLQVLLAQACYLSGQKVEAVEVCSQLLKKFPFCLEANRLLALILPGTERSQDAETYRLRAISLDPYLKKAAPGVLNADTVPDNAVSLEKLDYNPSETAATGPSQPAWAAPLGAAFDIQQQAEIAGWLNEAPQEGAPEEFPQLSQATDATDINWGTSTSKMGTAWLKRDKEVGPDAGQGEPEAAPSKEAPAEAAIPDWMKSAGWEPSDGGVPETPTKFEEAEVAGEGEISQGEMPDWLKSMAPPEAAPETGAAQPWLQENPPGASDSVVTWLSETKGETPQEDLSGLESALDQAVAAKIPPGAEPAETPVPDWLQGLEKQGPTTAELGMPDWLKAAEPEKPAEAASAEASMDWLQAIEAEQPAETTAQPAAEPSGEMPDWLKAMESETPAEPAVEAAAMETLIAQPPIAAEPVAAAEAGEVPDWLKAMETETPAEPVAAEPAAAEPVDFETLIAKPPVTAEPVAAAEAGEVPDWLKAMETETPAEPAAAEPAAAEPVDFETLIAKPPAAAEPVAAAETGEVPDWLKAMETETPAEPVAMEPVAAEEAAPAEPVAEPPAMEETLFAQPPAAPEAAETGLMDEDAALDFLASLAAKHEGEEGWLEGVVSETMGEDASVFAGQTPAVQPVAAEPVDFETLIAKPPAAAEPVAAEPVAAAEAGEIPDWLKAIETETPTESVAAEPAAAEPIDFETLIAKPPAAAEPVAAAETGEVPDWLKAIETETPIEPVAMGPEAVEPVAAEAAAAEEIPDWLKTMEPVAAEEAAPVEPVAEPLAMEETLFAQPPAAPEAAETGLMDEDAALDFLASLAAKHEGEEGWLEGVVSETMGEDASVFAGQTPAVQPVAAEPVDFETLIAKPPAAAEPVAAEPVAAAEAGEVPDWLKAIETETPTESAAEPVDFETLIAQPPVAAEPVAAAEAGEVPDWLKAIETETPAEPVAMEPEAVEPVAAEAAAAEEIPDWLKTMEPVAAEEAAPVEPVAEPPAMEETLFAQPPAAPEAAETGLMDEDAALDFLASLAAKHEGEEGWLEGVVSETMGEDASVFAGQTPAVQPVAAEPVDFETLIAKPPAAAEPVAAEPVAAAEAGEVPDWLKAIETETPTESAAEPVDFETLIAQPPVAAEPVAAAEAGEVPDWLKAIETETPAEPVAMEPKAVEPVAAEAAAAEEIPDWLKTMEPVAAEEAAPAEPVAEPPAMEETLFAQPPAAPEAAETGLMDEDAALDFLASLAAKHEGEEGWLEEVVSETMGEDASVYVARQAEMPSQPVVEPPVEETQPAPVVEEAAPSETEAIAWMESLAAKQGVPEEQLSTPQQGRPIEPPAWVTAGKISEEETIPAAPSIEEIPGWIKPPAETPLAATQPTSSAAEEDLSWITKGEEATRPVIAADKRGTQPIGAAPLKIDINAASLAQLERLPGLGFIAAQDILTYRQAHGPFYHLEDLANVPGLSMLDVESLRDHVEIKVAEPHPAPAEHRFSVPTNANEAALLEVRAAIEANDFASAAAGYNQLIMNNTLLPAIIQDLQETLSRQPQEINLWQTLGDAYLRNDQLQEALDAYSRAEELLR